MKLSPDQIKMIQIAVRAAGIRTAKFEGRYRMLLGQYRQPNGQPVDSCKQLNHEQFEDICAICESHGWQHPDFAPDHFRKLRADRGEFASYGQRAIIDCLYKDLGWTIENLKGFIEKTTKGEKQIPSELSTREASEIIEALKAILGRKDGRQYKTIEDVRKVY